ncbi:uncharacterized protein K02A2.6-like [Sabethes cyaneus]|uniref:uncharacterized protein K02A2.6-like n=1 Tax=Sabethes cyaneus TaxID=53552 RepID=UPI00237DDC0B|nr:uncharacterized protein K02A2.6-like [Sabethes cyaneus]
MYGYETAFIVQSATRQEAYAPQIMQPESSQTFAVLRNRQRNPNAQQWKRKYEETDSGWNQQKKRDANYDEYRGRGRRSRCSKCNRLFHKFGSCPALNNKCNSCGQRGHFAQINTISLTDALIDCRVGSSKPIRFLIDSGADVNTIGGDDWKRLKHELHTGTANLKPIQLSSDNELRPYASNKSIGVTCAFRAKIEVVGWQKPVIDADFLVVSEGTRSLLGRSTASDLKLLKVGVTVNNCETSKRLPKFPKVPGVRVKFCVDRSVPPTKNAYYNVPAAFRQSARARLAEMEKQGIIERVTTAPDWISGMSAVPKGKGDFRLVVNMRAPNRAIKREYYRLPLLDEMRVKLHGAKYFSKLDLTNAFYHLELHESSRDLTTFMSENGMFRFTRLMFGVNCAPEIFQREMTKILEGVENIITYIDDILIFGDTLEQLRKTTSQVLRILRQNNLTVNTGKCEFDQTRLKFLGYEVDENGFNIDEAKVKNIRRFRQPSTISELRSFLGLASFLSPYIQGFADLARPLWAVTSNSVWSWNEEQTKAYECLKDRIEQCTTSLGYFSETDKTILYTDASPYALGAVLIQDDGRKPPRVISFASKALTTTEKRYPQNQREALAAVWAVKHFAYFLLGRPFTLRTDAQGFTFILNRLREDSKRALNRADGWALRLSPYNFNVEYVRGRENIADPSSRLYAGTDGPFEEEISPWEVASLEMNQIQFLTEDEIKHATFVDVQLKKVIDALETGVWPKELRRFEALGSDLTIRDGILVKTGCAIIPENLRHKTLTIAHEGHPSVAKFKSILRERVWWPGMTKDAETWTNSCAVCVTNGRPERPTPMMRVFAPDTVWDTIALDFNGPYSKFGNVLILVIVDYRSRYIIAKPVKSTSFEHTRSILDEIFEKEGFPAHIKSDNGPPFNGEEYRQYCLERGIDIIFSTPFYPQQNGLAESCMKLINKAKAAASSSGANYRDELKAAICAYNSAAHSITGIPPEEVMTGRKVKRGLPLLNRSKATFDDNLLNSRDRKSKLEAKKREDAKRGARKCQVKQGDMVVVERQVRAKAESRFNPCKYTVIEERNGMLVLSDENGQILKRHVSQVKRVYEWREPKAIGSKESISIDPSIGP